MRLSLIPLLETSEKQQQNFFPAFVSASSEPHELPVHTSLNPAVLALWEAPVRRALNEVLQITLGLGSLCAAV